MVSLPSRTKRSTSSEMVKYCVADSLCFLCPWFLIVAALKDGKHSNNTQRVTIHEKAIVPCPELKEVIKNDGAFDILYWKICSSENCEDQYTTWSWLGGMNNEGTTKVKREGIMITSDGALVIENVQLSDAGHYMCTVKRINHMSPERHFVTLAVNRVATDEQGLRKTRNNTDSLDCKKDYSEDRGGLVCALIVATCVLSALLFLSVGYIVYLKHANLRCGNERNACT